MNKFLLSLVFVIVGIVGISCAVDGSFTVLPLLSNQMGLYGTKTTGEEVRLIGINSSDLVDIGATSGNIKINGALTLRSMVVSPNSSVTTSIYAGVNYLIFKNSATLGTANIVLPSSPVDGQYIVISPVSAISTATITAGSVTVKNGVTSFTAGTPVGYIYNASETSWFRSR